jgi:hypothetical protein
MDLNKAQGRQMVSSVSKSRESRDTLTSSVIRGDPDDPMTIMDVRSIPEETHALYAWLNKTIRCILFEQYRAYLKCPVCPEYGTCAQMTRKQRIELEASPFFSIKEIAWDGPRRIKNMYIAVCTDGSLRRLDNFDPKDTDGINIDQYKDVEEVLVVTKAFRRKVMWAPVPLEQVNAKRINGESLEESKNLINQGVNTTQTKQMARKETAKPKNGKK